MKDYFIYFIRTADGRRYYIGVTTNINKRWEDHQYDLSVNKHHSIKLQRFYNKYGAILEFGILMSGLTETNAFIYEKFLIKCFDAYRRGFNCTEGGENPPHYERSYYFKHMKTGEECTEKNLAKFAKQKSIFAPSLSEVLNGKKNFYLNWYCPNLWTPPTYSLLNPNGELVTFNKIAKFAREYNLNRTRVYLLIINKLRNVNGWTNPTKPKRKANNEKTFTLINHREEIVTSTNIKQFCQERGLQKSFISQLINGHISDYKGWALYVGPETVLPQLKQGYDRTVCNPNGVTFTFNNLKSFCKEHNLNRTSFSKMLRNRTETHKGWRKV